MTSVDPEAVTRLMPTACKIEGWLRLVINWEGDVRKNSATRGNSRKIKSGRLSANHRLRNFDGVGAFFSESGRVVERGAERVD